MVSKPFLHHHAYAYCIALFVWPRPAPSPAARIITMNGNDHPFGGRGIAGTLVKYQ